MAWNIGVIVNTIVVPEEFKFEFDQIMEDNFCDEPFDVYQSKIEMIEDYMEHMDTFPRLAVEYPQVAELFEKYKVNGDICFSSAEGDNKGSQWGYRFQDGVMTKLVGKTIFDQDQPE
jgi:hypothetical protein